MKPASFTGPRVPAVRMKGGGGTLLTSRMATGQQTELGPEGLWAAVSHLPWGQRRALWRKPHPVQHPCVWAAATTRQTLSRHQDVNQNSET